MNITEKRIKELTNVQLESITYAAHETYRSNNHSPVRILDLATGPNYLNPNIVKNLIGRGIDYELVLSDISPACFRRGYENLKMKLSSDELKKVKCVLADSTDLRKELTEAQIWSEKVEKVKLDEILENPRYNFLQTGYEKGKRTVDFSDGSFDMVIGNISYASMGKKQALDAIKESVRVLKNGGYHIVAEMQIEKIRSYKLRAQLTKKKISGKPIKESYDIIRRSLSAISNAKVKYAEYVKDNLDRFLEPVALHSYTYEYDTEERFPEQAVQKGDMTKLVILVHQKNNS